MGLQKNNDLLVTFAQTSKRNYRLFTMETNRHWVLSHDFYGSQRFLQIIKYVNHFDKDERSKLLKLSINSVMKVSDELKSETQHTAYCEARL